jgi:broad specificity phosphatase PhoE
MIRIILVRHGRTAWNEGPAQGRRFRGIIDLPLADEGLIQAEVTARRLADEPLDAVYSSPLQRAAHTAQIIAAAHGLPVQTLPGLGSMDYGDWAGQLDTDVARRWPELYRQWRQEPFGVQIPGGESAAALRERAMAAVQEALGRHTDGDTIVLVSHQVVTKTLICALAGLPNLAFWQVRQNLCNLSTFDYDPRQQTFTLVGCNDTCHLDPTLPRARGKGALLVLLRHGQTTWNAGAGEERFRGRTDLSLDEIGHAQAHAVAERLGAEAIDAVYTSPLLRARQTIRPLADRLNLPVQNHEGLLDIDYGRFHCLGHSEAEAAFPTRYSLWRDLPSRVRFPEGEGLVDVQARIVALLEELVARHPGQTVVLVGHQIVNKVVVCTVLDLALDQLWRIRQDTAAVDILSRDSVWHALCLNDTCHLTRGP